MMIETQHYINGTEIRPVNADSIGFKIDYTQDYNLPELNTDSILLANEAKQLVLDHISTYGVFEGVPYTVKVLDVSLDYYIDLTESPIINGDSDGEIEVKIKRRKSVSTFMEKARGTSFESINKTNPITTRLVQYVIIEDQQGIKLIILAINVFTLVKELQDAILKLVESAQDVIKAATPNIGVPPSVDTGDIIAAVVLLVARIAYAIFILIQLIKLIKKVIELLVPTVKQFKCSTVKELIIKGCEKLGYGFSSTFLDEFKNMAILPVPLLNPNPSVFEKLFSNDPTVYTKGYPSAIDTTPTLGSLIDSMLDLCSGELRVLNGVVHLESEFNDIPSVSIRNTLNVQSERFNEWTYNTGDAWKRYLLNYRFDVSDIHTLNNYQKCQVEYSTEPITIHNEDLVSIKGLVSVNLPFAIGVRKNDLNFFELELLKFAQFADLIINGLGGNGGFAAKVTNKIGVLQISQQQFGVSKLLYLSGKKQPSSYLNKIGAKAIYNKFHIKNQVKENFKKIFTSTIALSDYNFKDIINGGNKITDEITGEDLEILTIDWINETRTAEIQYSVESTEGNNTKTITIFE